jgi:hypothetical protein
LIDPPARLTDGGVGSFTKTRTLLIAAWISLLVQVEQLLLVHWVARFTVVAPSSGRFCGDCGEQAPLARSTREVFGAETPVVKPEKPQNARSYCMCVR